MNELLNHVDCCKKVKHSLHRSWDKLKGSPGDRFIKSKYEISTTLNPYIIYAWSVDFIWKIVMLYIDLLKFTEILFTGDIIFNIIGT
jgi:hypothetical protein